MGLAWTSLALVGFAMLAVSWAIGFVVYRASPRSTPNRFLAVMLIVYGSILGTRYGLRPLQTDVEGAFACAMLYATLLSAIAPGYLLFISTLKTPLVAPLQTRVGRVLLWAASVALPIATALSPGLFILGVNPDPPLTEQRWYFGRWVFLDGPGYGLQLVSISIIQIYALAATISAWRRATPGTAARSRAGAFTLAFGAQDSLFAAAFLSFYVLPAAWRQNATYAGVLEAIEMGTPPLHLALLTYGILRFHLFDIDLKIKRGISRGTLVAAFLVVFIGVAEVAQTWFQDEYGYLAGGLAAVALVLAVHPLQRMSERVANAAMPGVTGSPEYVAYRKLQVYRAAVESAREDGGIDARERAMLETLARELAIRPEDARAIEAEGSAA